MCSANSAKSLLCELTSNSRVNSEVFIMHFAWNGTHPKAGQFFMVKPRQSGVFLPRPISVCEFNPAQSSVKFLIAKRGKGTEELARMQTGEKAELTGPLGNTWEEFLPESKNAALIGGGAGIAPLIALTSEKPDCNFHFYAGFRHGFREKEEENAMLGFASNAKKLVVTAEDGRNALSGRIVDFFFEPQNYDAVFACGPQPMLKAVVEKCRKKNVSCFVSMEKLMACGVGACFGCTVSTKNGNRRCCADGPIFNAGELYFDE